MSFANIDLITRQTMDEVKSAIFKSVTTTGITVGSGLQGYFLEDGAKLLRPVLSPWRNRLPRVKAPVGSLAANWRAIVDINAANADPSVGFGYPGPVLETTTENVSAPFQVLAEGNQVLMDAQILAQNWDDVRADTGTNTLYSLMIDEDKKLLGGQAFALQTPAAAPTVATATTGGSIPASTAVYMGYVARGLNGYWFGGSSIRSANGTVTSGVGTTNTVTGTGTPVQGAVAYDWYAGSVSGTLYYFGTSATPVSPVLKAIPTVDGALSPLPGLAPFVTWASSSADSSANANSINGLLPTMAGDYLNGGLVAHGTSGATPSGAYFTDLGGAQLTAVGGTMQEIDAALINIWNNFNVSPTLMLVNAQQFKDIANGAFATGGGRAIIPSDNPQGRQGLTAGYTFDTYINPAVGGQRIEIMSEPHMPPGTIIGVSEVLPYPNSRVAQVMDVCTELEYMQYEYGPSRVPGSSVGGPRWDFEVRAIEAFRNYFPAGCFAITGIGSGYQV